MSSPTQRSLKKLRDDGFLAEVTEHWNQYARIRKDLFGFIDIVAVKDKVTIGVQTTSYGNMGARVKKIQESENLAKLLAGGWRIIVHGWRKNKSNRWEVKEREL